jgi:hypothetical protein
MSDTDKSAETRSENAGTEGLSLHFLAPSDRPGMLGRMDHYDILEMVGKGGMGLVLKAFDTRLHRVVAIKVMAPHLAADATARKRFEREAQAGAAVNHKHVVAIHAVEAQHNPPYLVMEFIEGRSLSGRIHDEGPPEVKEIVRLGSEIASGLAAAHERGLIHRDIKPANILLENKTERVKITDFGLARAAHEARLTQSGLVTGTPKYMSPEQALGQSLDARSDLFSLGSVLYFLCTGKAPFHAGNTLAVLNQVVKDGPPPIQELNPAIPNWLCDLVAKLQAKDAAQRIQSARGVAEILSQPSKGGASLGVAQVPQPGEMGEQGPATVDWVRPDWLPEAKVAKPWRRRKVWLASATGAMVLALTLAIVLILHRGEQPTARPIDQPSPGRKLPSTHTVANSFQPFSPATLADRSAFRLPSLPRRRQGILGECSCIPRGFSPDGKWLLTVSDGDPVVRVWDVATGKQHKELPCTGDITRGPTFSHDGAWLAVYGMDGLVTLWDTKTFTPVRTLERQPWRLRSAAFDSEDRILATGRQDGMVQFWEVATGRKVDEFSVSSFPVLGLDFLPGNKRLAVFAPNRPPQPDPRVDIWYYDCTVQTVDIDEKSPTFKQTLCQWEAPDTQFILFSVMGEQLYFLKNRYQEDPSLASADAATGKIREIKSLPRITPITIVAVPARRLLVGYADKVARLWNTETAKVEWELALPSKEDYGNFALHPDGKTLAFGADDLSRVHFFSLETRKEILPPP